MTPNYLTEGKHHAADEINSLLGLVSSGEINIEYLKKVKVLSNLANIELVGLKLIVKTKK